MLILPVYLLIKEERLFNFNMSIKFRLRVFRKPAHWSEERYEKYLKEKNYFKTIKELKKEKKVVNI